MARAEKKPAAKAKPETTKVSEILEEQAAEMEADATKLRDLAKRMRELGR